MGKWADRLKKELAATPPATTAKTDKRGVLSVLAVPHQWGAGEISDTTEGSHPFKTCSSRLLDAAAQEALNRRRSRLLLWGLPLYKAEALAARLAARDLAADDRRMYMECISLERTGRCARARMGKLAGADRVLEPVPDILHRCTSFMPRPLGKPEGTS